MTPLTVRDVLAVMDGVPCFVGTRVPIESVLAALDSGYEMQDLRAWCPSLTDQHVQAAWASLRDHPGKTSRASLVELNPDWRVVERRQVRRPSKVRIGSAIGLYSGWDDINVGDAEILETSEVSMERDPKEQRARDLDFGTDEEAQAPCAERSPNEARSAILEAQPGHCTQLRLEDL